MELDDPGILSGINLGIMGSNSEKKENQKMSEKNMWAQMVQSKHFNKSFKQSESLSEQSQSVHYLPWLILIDY